MNEPLKSKSESESQSPNRRIAQEIVNLLAKKGVRVSEVGAILNEIKFVMDEAPVASCSIVDNGTLSTLGSCDDFWQSYKQAHNEIAQDVKEKTEQGEKMEVRRLLIALHTQMCELQKTVNEMKTPLTV